jgi:class 3 adenylate cyclase
MTFEEILDQAIDMLRRRGRLTYRALKRQFNLDDAYLGDLKEELIEGQRLAVDEQGKVLVWRGDREPAATPAPAALPATIPVLDPARGPVSYTPPHLVEKILTSRSALEGERKQVSVLFCDLANSTALAARLGPEAMHGLLNRFFALALDTVHRYEGTINQFLGDGFMALFGAPLTHEDHARRAVLAALGLQRALQDQHADLGGPHGVECTVRVGLNSGLVVVGGIGDNLRMDYTAIGDTTNLAARLQQVADPGTVLISAATRQFVQGYVQLEALPPLQLKGVTAPVSAFRVVGLSRRRSPIALRGERSLSQFVGRTRELATLEALLARVEAGEGQVVGVVGEAGAGKSRLLFEFRQCLRDRPVTYLEGRCLSYGRAIPYVPLLDLLRHNCGITDTETPETLTAKVCISLQEVGMDTAEWVPYLLHLFGIQTGTEQLGVLSPEAIKARTFELIRQMSLNGSQRQPLIFEVEDLHWMDTTSEAFFALLAESLNAARILVLGTYRPGYRPPWLEQSNATQIALPRLTREDSLVVIRSLAPPERLPEPIVQTILAKAEGNPFFLEELTRTVLDVGESPAAVVVPDTVQGVLMARIDQLPEVTKSLLQTAAVLGREFSLHLLSAIWAEPGSLAPLLLELKRLEFVYEQTGVEEPTYVFKHALTQDVAYESLLTTRRQTLHAAAGLALERLYAARLEDVYDRLAYHYAKTDETDKAVDYLMRFAEKAARSYAHADAVTALQEALVHVARLPVEARDRRTLEITLRLVNSLYFLGRFQESLNALLQQRECLERLQDPALAGPYYFWLSHTYSYRREAALTAQSAQYAIAAAQQCGDEVTLGKA